MNKKILITILIILGLAIIAGGFYLWLQKKAELRQNNAEKQIIENDKQERKGNEKNKTKLIQDFESFIKNHGKKIELEKIDTTDWKTYTDKERGFSFKYPKDWYVVKIDSSKEKEDYYSPKNQRIEKSLLKRGTTDGYTNFINSATICDKKFTDPATIKSCAKSFAILCIVDKYKYEELPKKLTQTTDGFSNKQYCNMVVREYLPTLKSSKKSSGEMLLDSAMASTSYNSDYIITSGDVYIPIKQSKKYRLFSIRFIIPNNTFIEFTDINHGSTYFNNIIQTINYTK